MRDEQEACATFEIGGDTRVKTWRERETWACAGGKEIKGKVTIHWTTGSGVPRKGVFKVGAVSSMLISVDRLQETGHDVIL